MNKKTLILFALVVPLLTVGAGCVKSDTNKLTSPATMNQEAANSADLVTSTRQAAGLDILKFPDPQNKNILYYVTNSSGTSYVWQDDTSKHRTPQPNQADNITDGLTILLSQKHDKNYELRSVGIVNNKFVFVQTRIDNSPGFCVSLWLYEQLAYIDLGVANPTQKSFTLPADLKIAEQKKVDECNKQVVTSLKNYSDENYTFEYPQTYEIKQKTQPVRVIVEGKNGRLEIFQLKSPNGERPKDFGFEGANPPQKMKVVENNKTWFDVWMYYDANDKNTEDKLMAIFDSIELK